MAETKITNLCRRVDPFIKWYLPRLQARYQVVQRILDEVLTDRESIKVADPNVYGSLLIQSAVLGWLDINFRVELEREARRTGVPTLDLTQRRLIYLAERIKTFSLKSRCLVGPGPRSERQRNASQFGCKTGPLRTTSGSKGSLGSRSAKRITDFHFGRTSTNSDHSASQGSRCTNL
jgi:hypothetical protein